MKIPQAFINGLVGICAALLFGCSTSQMSYRDLALPDEINHDFQKPLTRDQVRYDLTQLKYALTHAYSGRKYLPGNQFSELVKHLDAISGPMTALDFCRAVESQLDQVLDSHLHAQLYRDRCKTTERPHGQVESNFYSGEKAWHVELRSRQGVRAVLISIRSFPGHTSPEWNGFIDSVQSLLPRARLVILDMRGNDGGDDTKGKELSDLLAGLDLKSHYSNQWQSQTPENEQLAINADLLFIKMAEKQHHDSAYLQKMALDDQAKLAEAIAGKLPSETMRNEGAGQPFDPVKAIKKPIYILIDRSCISSCESTTDFFEFNPWAKTVGENTGGFNHFGNNAYLVMRNSGVAVMMASAFSTYADGRFIEKKGITPRVPVPPGQDAMKYAWDDYFRSSRKNAENNEPKEDSH